MNEDILKASAADSLRTLNHGKITDTMGFGVVVSSLYADYFGRGFPHDEFRKTGRRDFFKTALQCIVDGNPWEPTA